MHKLTKQRMEPKKEEGKKHEKAETKSYEKKERKVEGYRHGGKVKSC